MGEPGDAERLLVIHKRLLDGDRVAPEELAAHLLERLAQEVARKFPHTDVHFAYDGVTDALLDYCAKPAAFNASRGVPLDRFLAQAAWRNVANLVRGEQRRKAREEKSAALAGKEDVELHPSAGNPLQNAERSQEQQAELVQMLDDPMDKKVFQLRLTGERRTAVFAQVMGISHLPLAEQRRTVKKAKDRIDVLLRRKKGTRA
jgi:DNA-directed RNA polymerase specialized sigma24 family protein